MSHIAIRPWTMADTAAMAAIMNNENIQTYLREGIPFPYTEADALDFFKIIQAAEADTRYDFAVTYGD